MPDARGKKSQIRNSPPRPGTFERKGKKRNQKERKGKPLEEKKQRRNRSLNTSPRTGDKKSKKGNGGRPLTSTNTSTRQSAGGVQIQKKKPIYRGGKSSCPQGKGKRASFSSLRLNSRSKRHGKTIGKKMRGKMISVAPGRRGE